MNRPLQLSPALTIELSLLHSLPFSLSWLFCTSLIIVLHYMHYAYAFKVMLLDKSHIINYYEKKNVI